MKQQLRIMKGIDRLWSSIFFTSYESANQIYRASTPNYEKAISNYAATIPEKVFVDHAVFVEKVVLWGVIYNHFQMLSFFSLLSILYLIYPYPNYILWGVSLHALVLFCNGTYPNKTTAAQKVIIKNMKHLINKKIQMPISYHQE